MTGNNPIGKTTLTPNVILTIARMAALDVEGVTGMASIRSGIPNLKSRGREGVMLQIEDDNVFLNLYLVLDGDHNIQDVSRKVQQQVARSIEEMTGLEVSQVNIHIEDVDFKNDKA